MDSTTKTCRICQQTKPLEEFPKLKRSKDGFDTACKECQNAKNRAKYAKDPAKVIARTQKWKLENRETYLPQQREAAKIRNQTPHGRFKRYEKEAKDQEHVFQITFEEFMKYWQQPCYYCDREIKTIGLDRIDSDKGYLLDNIVSCCHDCNTGKSDQTQENFIKLCKTIAKEWSQK